MIYYNFYLTFYCTYFFRQVSKLFQNQEDLLAEFGQFLPEATGEAAASVPHPQQQQPLGLKKKTSIMGSGGPFKPIGGGPGMGAGPQHHGPPGR